MSDEVKCPKCNGLMEEGFLLDRGPEHFLFQSNWVEGKAEKSFWTGLNIKNRKQREIILFRCSVCGFLEFYAPE
jgi:predicted nucleic-acid-binding Zn-ribbon protein